MIQFLMDYGLFLLKTITFIAAIIFTLISVLALLAGHGKSKQKLIITNINTYFSDLKSQLQQEIFSKKELKNKKKQEKKEQADKKSIMPDRPKLFILNFEGDIQASAVKNLREEITAILTIATPKDEVLLKITSTGGVVHGYGLAAAQLQRIRAKNIHLSVSIDKVAASGGYMMACVADTLFAAPFAIIGSIGVVAQIPNLHRYLEDHKIDIELLTAGKYKRTLTLLGKNTEEGRQKAQHDIDDVHELFKTFIKQNRPIVPIDEVATGEYWYGAKALEKQLVDRLMTSDEYLLSASNSLDLYEISYQTKKSWTEKLATNLRTCLHKTIHAALEFNTESRYP